jgi:hypothetical protein
VDMDAIHTIHAGVFGRVVGVSAFGGVILMAVGTVQASDGEDVAVALVGLVLALVIGLRQFLVQASVNNGYLVYVNWFRERRIPVAAIVGVRSTRTGPFKLWTTLEVDTPTTVRINASERLTVPGRPLSDPSVVAFHSRLVEITGQSVYRVE